MVEFSIKRYAVQINAGTVDCLYGDFGRAEENLMAQIAVGAGGQTTSITPAGGRHIQRVSGVFCPRFAVFQGTGQVFVLANTTRITVTLI